MTAKAFSERPGRFLILWLAVCAVGMVIAAWLYYQRQRETVDAATIDQLAAIADFKGQQIANWRSERLGDGRVLAVSPVMAEAQRALTEARPAEPDRAAILAVMRRLSREFLYTDAAVVDLNGSVRIQLHEERGNAEARRTIFRGLAQGVVASQEAALADLALTPPTARPLMMLAIPVGKSGAMILEIDPEAFLYPYLRSWPTPAQTAETLLIRREGDSVLELSPMKYAPNAALTFRVPTPKSLPEESQLLAGWPRRSQDYRGAPVLGVIKRVPDAPWYLSVKIDRSEAEAPLRRLAWELTLVVALLAIANGAGVGLFWRNRQLQVSRELEAWFRTVANDTPAYLWMSSPEGENSFLNQPMIKFFGIDGRDLGADWLPTIHPEAQQRVRQEYMAALGARREFVSEFQVRRFDGEYRWVVSRGVPRFSEKGEFQGYAGSLVDITERREAEAQLRATNRELAAELQERTRAEREIHDFTARVMNAQEAERSRLARDLHDDLGQQIAALNLGVFNLKRKISSQSDALAEGERIQQSLVRLAERREGFRMNCTHRCSNTPGWLPRWRATARISRR